MNKNINVVQRKFVFVKQYKTLNVGDILTITMGAIYFNGGLMPASYQIEFRNLIEKELVKPNYLQELTLIKNEF
jgi:methionine aminopeptidase